MLDLGWVGDANEAERDRIIARCFSFAPPHALEETREAAEVFHVVCHVCQYEYRYDLEC